VGAEPQVISPFDISHQDVCTTAVWINSKSGTEFMSAGLDGQVRPYISNLCNRFNCPLRLISKKSN